MEDRLVARLESLGGRRISAAEMHDVSTALPWAPRSVLELMERFPIAGARFTIDESVDESALGVEMRWLTPREMIDEATNVYPGVAAAHSHYFPIGECLIGTGDPYFVRADDVDAPVFRIPHTAVGNDDSLLAEQIERVAPSLRAFFSSASSE